MHWFILVPIEGIGRLFKALGNGAIRLLIIALFLIPIGWCSEIKKGRDWREVLFHTSSPVSNNIPDICKDINKYCLSYTDDTYKNYVLIDKLICVIYIIMKHKTKFKLY